MEHAVKAPPSRAKCHDISVVSWGQLSVKDNPFLAWREAGSTRHKLRHLRHAFSRERLFNETASARLSVAVICAFYRRPATKRSLRHLVFSSLWRGVSNFPRISQRDFSESGRMTKFSCIAKQCCADVRVRYVLRNSEWFGKSRTNARSNFENQKFGITNRHETLDNVFRLW